MKSFPRASRPAGFIAEWLDRTRRSRGIIAWKRALLIVDAWDDYTLPEYTSLIETVTGQCPPDAFFIQSLNADGGTDCVNVCLIVG
jgi:hypothetical protein